MEVSDLLTLYRLSFTLKFSDWNILTHFVRTTWCVNHFNKTTDHILLE